MKVKAWAGFRELNMEASCTETTVTVGVRMTPQMREKLIEISERNQRTLSNQIRVFLNAGIDAEVER